MLPLSVPGVYLEHSVSKVLDTLPTGLPVFIGQVERSPGLLESTDPEMFALTHWQSFSSPEKFGAPVEGSYLFKSVKGFFENGGRQCYILGLQNPLDEESLADALEEITVFQRADLICVPDLASDADLSQVMLMQNLLLEFCERDGSFFSILDSVANADLATVIRQRDAFSLENGALYYPWIRVSDELLPPCGHIAGVFARSDAKDGVFKSPANEALNEVQSLALNIGPHEHGLLNPHSINVVRANPGRGIRVMGARALGVQGSPVSYVGTQRLIITLKRWAEENLRPLVFEPINPRLCQRVVRKIGAYLNELYSQGAFSGSSAENAYFIKCDDENNPEQLRSNGMLVVDLGIVPAGVNEFIVFRLIRQGHDLQFNQILPAHINSSGDEGTEIGGAVTPGIVGIESIAVSDEGSLTSHEHIVLRNTGQYSLSLLDWRLRDQNDVEYRFPDFMLAPYASVKIWTASGRNNSANLYWGRTAPVWTNRGNVATLEDDSESVITTYSYLV